MRSQSFDSAGSLYSPALAEPDWSDGNVGTVTITAASQEGGSTACLTGAGLTSSTPDPVIDAAIARGSLTWSRPASISTTPLTDGDTTRSLNSVSEMLGAYANQSAARLYVDGYRRLLKGADPTQPEFFIIHGAELSWTTDRQADAVIGGWHNSAGAPQITTVGSGPVERLVSLDNLGPLDSTRATAVLTSILSKSSSGGWSNGLTLSAGQFLGSPSLAEIGARVGRGLMVRLNGQRDPRPDRPPVGYIDFIVERAEWHVADGTITLTPRGMVASDFASILATAGVEEAA
jgi:hypothetical protein